MKSIAARANTATLRPPIARGGGRPWHNREYGFNALLSLRLEKSFGIWSAEFTQGLHAGHDTGMDRWIDLGQGRLSSDAQSGDWRRARRQRAGAGTGHAGESTPKVPTPAAMNPIWA